MQVGEGLTLDYFYKRNILESKSHIDQLKKSLETKGKSIMNWGNVKYLKNQL